MTLNLKPYEKIIQAYMDDVVTVTRLVGGAYNPALLKTVKTYEVVVANSKCLIAPMGGPGSHDYGHEDMERTYYEFGFPLATPLIKPNDIITVVSSLRDTLMSGREFTVQGIIPGTFVIHRRVAAWTDQSAS